jgi:hypothetical protein
MHERGTGVHAGKKWHSKANIVSHPPVGFSKCGESDDHNPSFVLIGLHVLSSLASMTAYNEGHPDREALRTNDVDD